MNDLQLSHFDAADGSFSIEFVAMMICLLNLKCKSYEIIYFDFVSEILLTVSNDQGMQFRQSFSIYIYTFGYHESCYLIKQRIQQLYTHKYNKCNTNSIKLFTYFLLLRYVDFHTEHPSLCLSKETQQFPKNLVNRGRGTFTVNEYVKQ